MILRLIIIAAIIGLVLAAFTPRRSQTAIVQRRRAMRVAFRQTLFAAAAIAFAGLAAFGLWHGFRHDDQVARLVALVAVPLAVGFAWLSWRATRPTRG